jgi:hypothetical protein
MAAKDYIFTAYPERWAATTRARFIELVVKWRRRID